MKDAYGRLRYGVGDAKAARREDAARAVRIRDLYLGASGMRYFGDHEAADALELAARELSGKDGAQ